MRYVSGTRRDRAGRRRPARSPIGRHEIPLEQQRARRPGDRRCCRSRTPNRRPAAASRLRPRARADRASTLRVFAAIERAKQRPARIRGRRRGLSSSDSSHVASALVGALIRTRHALRRHRARASACARRFPRFRRGPGVGDVHAIEREVGCFRALIVAGDAVAIDDGARVEGGVRRSRRRRRRALSAVGRQDGPPGRQHPRRCDCERDSSHLTPGTGCISSQCRPHLISTQIRARPSIGCMTVPRSDQCPDQVTVGRFCLDFERFSAHRDMSNRRSFDLCLLPFAFCLLPFAF